MGGKSFIVRALGKDLLSILYYKTFYGRKKQLSYENKVFFSVSDFQCGQS